MANVVTNFASDDKEVIAAIDKMNKKLGELQEKNRKLAEDTAKSSKQAASSFDDATDALAGMAAGYLSVAAAVGLVTKELQSKFELEQKAADLQKVAANAERDFLRNLGLVGGANQQSAIRNLQQIGQRQGVPMADLYGAAGAALSASGGDIGKTMSAVEEAAKIAPDSPQVMQELASAMIDLGKATKSGDVQEGLRILIASGQLSRVKDWRQLGINAPQGIVGASNYGASAESATAMFAALSNVSADPTGAMTATAMVQLSKQLRDALPENDTYSFDGKGRRKLDAKGTGLTSFDERLQHLWNNPEAAERLKASLVGEAKMMPGMEQLITPGSVTQKAYLDNLKTIQGISGKGFGASLDNTALQQNAKLDRAGEEQMLRELTNATGSGRYAIIRANVDKAAQAAGFGYVDRTMAGINAKGRSFAQDPFSMGIGALEDLQDASRARKNVYGVDTKGPSGREAVDVLQEQIEILRASQAALERMEKNQKGAGAGNKVEGQ